MIIELILIGLAIWFISWLFSFRIRGLSGSGIGWLFIWVALFTGLGWLLRIQLGIGGGL